MKEDSHPKNGPGEIQLIKGDVEYTMKAVWNNGKKEGTAEIKSKQGRAHAELTFVGDEITGGCVIRHRSGLVAFEGQMKKG